MPRVFTLYWLFATMTEAIERCDCHMSCESQAQQRNDVNCHAKMCDDTSGMKQAWLCCAGIYAMCMCIMMAPRAENNDKTIYYIPRLDSVTVLTFSAWRKWQASGKEEIS